MVNQREGEKLDGNIIGLLGLSKSVICFALDVAGIVPPAIEAAENAKNERLDKLVSVIAFYPTGSLPHISRLSLREYTSCICKDFPASRRRFRRQKVLHSHSKMQPLA